MLMKTMDELTGDEARSLEVGAEVAMPARRDANFRTYTPDTGLVLFQLPSHLTISFQRGEPQSVTAVGRVVAQSPLGPQLMIERVESKSSAVEDAQVRMTPESGIELGIAILYGLVGTHGEHIRRRIQENPSLAALFAPHE